jgi:uncharacterized protein YkwD
MKLVKRFQKNFCFCLLGVLIVLSSCAERRPAQPVMVPAERSKPRIAVSELEKRIHILINEERRKHGLTSLAWNGTLSKIATRHSSDMAKRNYFSHYSPEGHDFFYRYRQAGYSCAVPDGERIYLGAENIFQNNLYDRIVFVNDVAHYEWNSMTKIAKTTVRGWMNSPDHRKNILTPHWKSEGIGVAVSPDNKVYITENFC